MYERICGVFGQKKTAVNGVAAMRAAFPTLRTGDIFDMFVMRRFSEVMNWVCVGCTTID